MSSSLRTSTGRPYPFGASVVPGGINFAVFSQHGTGVYLELFDAPDDARAAHSVQLDPRKNRTGDVWHIFVAGLEHGQLYGFRVDGPYTPAQNGHRFNVNKLLSDPYARAVVGEYEPEADAIYGYDRDSELADLSFSSADSTRFTVKSVALELGAYDWGGDRQPRIPLDDSVFYEVHVKGFTCHPSSGVKHPGTYLGIIDKIPHLLDLGVTAIELLPVHEFNQHEPAGIDPVSGSALTNYWGYSTLSFFAPEQHYASNGEALSAVDEFKEMVKALHRAGIEVILDVVFNHTGEGDQFGPTYGLARPRQS